MLTSADYILHAAQLPGSSSSKTNLRLAIEAQTMVLSIMQREGMPVILKVSNPFQN